MALTGDEIYKISSKSKNKIQRYLNDWLRDEDSKRRILNKFIHVDIQDVYQWILDELFEIEHKFYKNFDAQKLKRQSTRRDWREFAVSELNQVFGKIYWMENSNELVNHKLLECDESFTWIDPHKKLVREIRQLYAERIWFAWSHERHWGPRVGQTIISNKPANKAKVLLVGYIKDNVLYLGFPKGKPEKNESIKVVSIRETSEETGISRTDLCTYTGHVSKRIIEKHPYIGPRSKRQHRQHIYVITTTTLEFTTFNPPKHEIQDVSWYSVDNIPCCDDCCIRSLIEGQGMKINFHMVTLRDLNNKNPIILDILNYLDEINGNTDASTSYFYAHRRCRHDLA